MLCPKCGFYSEGEESVCPECGAILRHSSVIPTEGPQAIRQGKRAREAAWGRARVDAAEEAAGRRARRGDGQDRQAPRVADTRDAENGENGRGPQEYGDGANGENGRGPQEYGDGANGFDGRTRFGTEDQEDFGAGRRRRGSFDGVDDEGDEDGAETLIERRRRNFYDDEADEETAMRYLGSREGAAPRRMVNWMKFVLFGAVILAVLAAGGWLFLKKTDAGQRFLARLGKDASSVAYWAVGDEKMNSGDVDGAIECFETARAKDAEEGVIDVDGLLELGSALEAADRTREAADLYEEIYTQTPSRTEAYVNHIRILQNSGSDADLVKAGELMKLAYEKTGDKTFLTQRTDLLPAAPEVTPIAGYYETKRTLVLTSYQGFDVYYTFDENAELPAEGIKATPEGVMLDEGIYNLRAVAVDGGLVSDELKGTWKIIMPSPMTPRATLAPNTYKSRQSVKLKPGVDDERDTSIVIYYTIDGSIPDSDSPIFDGEPITLPTGWVTLNAYAVNRYRKLSNMLTVKYKIDVNPWPKTAFGEEDTIGKIVLLKTTQSEFSHNYGEGEAAGPVEMEGFDTECRRFDYPWGYVVMNLQKRVWVLAEVCFGDGSGMTGPRDTKIGDTEEAVVGAYKDMGQIASKSGNRGLYALDSGASGKIWLQENGEKIIRYRYPVSSSWVQLEYVVSAGGTVSRIDYKYIP